MSDKDEQAITHGKIGQITAMSWPEIRAFMTRRSWLAGFLMTDEEYVALRDNGIHESFTPQRRAELSAFIQGWLHAKA